MKNRIFALCIAIVLISFILTGCVPGDGTYTLEKPAGFFWGGMAWLDSTNFTYNGSV